jgi:hypothetical protein
MRRISSATFSTSWRIERYLKVWRYIINDLAEFQEFFDKFRHDPFFAWVDGFVFEIKGLQNAQETPTDIVEITVNAGLLLGGQDFTPEEKIALEHFF